MADHAATLDPAASEAAGPSELRASSQGPLAPEEDTYGQIYLALLAGRPAQEIMEREDGLIYGGDASDYFHPFRRWPAGERQAMRHARGRVLDVGCGCG